MDRNTIIGLVLIGAIFAGFYIFNQPSEEEIKAAEEKAKLDAVCDVHLARLLEILSPDWAVGVGAFAESKILAVSKSLSSPPRVARILHPSPASPAANRGWDKAALRQLQEAGVWEE